MGNISLQSGANCNFRKEYCDWMELIPLVEEGDYDIGAFESAQYDYFGTWPYVLVKRDGILYAFHDTSNEGFGGTKPTEKGGSSEQGLQSPTQTPTSTQTSTSKAKEQATKQSAARLPQTGEPAIRAAVLALSGVFVLVTGLSRKRAAADM